MITARRVRLRILNASTARIYHLAFADDREFSIIGTDCGFCYCTPSGPGTCLLSPPNELRSCWTCDRASSRCSAPCPGI